MAGLSAGLFGLGGGIVIIPGLVFFFQSTQLIAPEFMMHVAIATSLVLVFFISLASLMRHSMQEAILWSLCARLAPGLMVGACLGSAFSLLLSSNVLNGLFILFLCVVAIKMWRSRNVSFHLRPIAPWLCNVVSVIIGAVSAVLGIGGGLLLIPFLTYIGIGTKQIAPIANVCGMVIATVGALFFLVNGQHVMVSYPYFYGYVYWPAILGIVVPSCLMASVGAKLSYIIPTYYLKYGFIAIVLLTAAKMLLAIV